MHFRKIALFAAVAALSLPVVAGAGPIKAGKWQTTVETTVVGMDMKMPPASFEHCVTPEEAEKPQPPKGRNESCRTEDYKLDGNAATWKIKCDKPEASGEGKITFAGESFEGDQHMKMKNPQSGQEMEINQKMTGKRIGDCEPEPKK